MPDQHVTRTGEDYSVAMQALLPQGQAWPRAYGSMLMKVVRGLTGIWGDVENSASKLLEVESDPRITADMLPDWERNFGLPDPCYDAPQSVQERQLALISRMTIEGEQSRQFYIEVAAGIGYTISISEFRVFIVGIDRCGDNRMIGTGFPMLDEWFKPVLDPQGMQPDAGELSAWPCYGIGPPSNRFYWTVHVHSAKLTWFRASDGQAGVNSHLEIEYAEDLECLLNRWKPAHTTIIFDYSDMSTGGSMAGTP